MPRAPSCPGCGQVHPGDLCPAGVSKWMTSSPFYAELMKMAQCGVSLNVAEFVPFVPRVNRVPNCHVEVVSQKISDELERGWLVPVPFHDLPHELRWAAAPLQIVEEPTKMRLVTDYSYVQGGMKLGINGKVDVASLGEAYMHRCADVAGAVHRLARDGHTPVLLVRDLSKAFRRLGVEEADVPMLHTEWNGLHMWDTRLPFGHAASAHAVCLLTRAIALEVTRRCRGSAECLCYVDDFVLVARPDFAEQAQLCLESLLRDLNLPVSEAKARESGSWSTSVVWIGYSHDTVLRTHAVSPAKLQQLMEELQMVQRQPRDVSVKFLRSMIGRMNHAANVCSPCRAFVRSLHSLVAAADRAELEFVSLSAEVIRDVHWWLEFLPDMPLLAPMRTPPNLAMPCVATDASLTGGGAVFHSSLRMTVGGDVPRWRHMAKIPASAASVEAALGFGFAVNGKPEHMALLEATAAYVAVREWRRSGLIEKGSRFWLQLDNEALVHALRAGRARDWQLNCVIKRLLALCVRDGLRVYPFHVYSQDNEVADRISRMPAQSLWSSTGRFLNPQSGHRSMPVPLQWLEPQNWIDLCL